MIRHILKDGTEIRDISGKVVPKTVKQAYQILERTENGNYSKQEQDCQDRRKVLL